MSEHDNEIDDGIEAPETTTALAPARTLDELAALKSDALDNMKARGNVMDMARRIMVAATFPTDYVNNRAPDGSETLYLQDKGADRVRDILGIEIFGVSRHERIATNDPAVFHYVIRGSGRCRLTGQVIEDIEGGRSSTDDFCKGKTGLELELAVRKAARANLDGRITRKLAGLQSIPVQFVDEVWKDTPKRTAQCPRGRGFGTRDERLGGGERPDVGITPPPCPVCQKPMLLRKGSKGYFYSCADYKDHGPKARTIDLDKWKTDPKAHAGLTPAQAAGFTGQPTKVTPPPAEEIFGGGRAREPGEDDE